MKTKETWIGHPNVFPKYHFPIKNWLLKISEASLKKVKSQVSTLRHNVEVSNREKVVLIVLNQPLINKRQLTNKI